MLGLIVAVGLVYFLRENGIAFALVGVAAMTLLASWWYSRRVDTQRVSMSTSQVAREAQALLKLGVAFMASGLLTLGAAYAIRLIVTRKIGVEAAGLYQCAWTLGGLYVGFVLQSMGADFYPRLTAAAHDDAECNRLVNEQAQISLLLAAPGIVGTLAFAPVVIELFYSSKFDGAVPIVRWFCLGMILRVVAWPMGFIVLAKGWQAIFFWTEAAATLVHVGLAFLLVPLFGPAGAGAAFFGLYLWHSILIYAVVRRLSGFRWSAANRRLGAFLLPLAGGVATALFLFPHWLTTTLCAVRRSRDRHSLDPDAVRLGSGRSHSDRPPLAGAHPPGSGVQIRDRLRLLACVRWRRAPAVPRVVDVSVPIVVDAVVALRHDIGAR